MGDDYKDAEKDCPCIDASDLLLKFSNCEVTATKTNDKGIIKQFSQEGIKHLVKKGNGYEDVCIPISYGSNYCHTHDLGVDPRCTLNPASIENDLVLENPSNSTFDDDILSSSNISTMVDFGENTVDLSTLPDWCTERWCYVDYEKCRRSPEAVYRSQMFDSDYPEMEDLYWSYSLCNSSASSFLSFQTTRHLEGITFRASIPIIRNLAHYKVKAGTELEVAENKGMEYYNDSIPWEGYIIRYFNDVVKLSNIKAVEYTFRSKGADELYDPFTGTVHDVRAGLTDMALSTFWITSDRLQMTPYTTPVAVDQVVLWIPEPKSRYGGVRENVVKILRPFDGGLWMTLTSLIVLVALVNVWLANTRGVTNTAYPNMNRLVSMRASGEHVPMTKRIKIIAGSIFDSLIMFSNFMFGHSVELDEHSTRAQKVLMFGFAFLILVAVASYTANLAAFLTVASQVNYVSSMKEAVYKKIPICVNPALLKEIQIVYPEAQLVTNNEDKTLMGMVEYFKLGKCDAIANSAMEVRGTERFMEMFCENSLVSTGSLVIENPIAFPISEHYAGGLSYWLWYAAKRGIKFADYAEAGYPDKQCILEISSSFDEDDDASKQLSAENFTLPIILCIGCTILSLIIHQASKPVKNISRSIVAVRSSRGSFTRNNSLAADGSFSAIANSNTGIRRRQNSSSIQEQSPEEDTGQDEEQPATSFGLGSEGNTDVTKRIKEILASQEKMMSMLTEMKAKNEKYKDG